ncbi:MAG: NUDIX domain-containing protein [Candidatus Nanopelagicales bacterium]
MTRDPHDLIRAAGVVLRDDAGHVAVVHRARRQDWSLPKGKLEHGESHLLAAVRECQEETGSLPVLGPPLAARSYEVDGVPKTVRSWSARAVSGAFVVNDEVDELRWIDPEDADAVLSYPEDAALVRQAVALPDTAPLLVVRHAEAVKRAAWAATGAAGSGSDMARPLAPAGLVQSDVVAEVLAAYGVRRVLSSPSRRCRQTVGPYAALCGVAVEQVYELSEEGWVHDAEATATFVRGLLPQVSVPTAICSHRPVLPLVLGTILGEVDLDESAAHEWAAELDPRLPPAAAIVLHLTKTGALVAVERHESK